MSATTKPSFPASLSRAPAARWGESRVHGQQAALGHGVGKMPDGVTYLAR
ncbi:hypothetical protein NKG05_18755 [Oerskovia sp. M15]